MTLLAALVIGSIVVSQTPAAENCLALPTANGANPSNDLYAQAAVFPTGMCGMIRVTCPGIDDMDFYTLTIPAATERAREISIWGHGMSSFNVESLAEYAAAGISSIAFAAVQNTDHDRWLCARDDCPPYTDPTEPGVLAAACRPATIFAVYQPPAGEAYCAQAHSTGAAAAMYALTHYGQKELDYLQMSTGAPAARMDYGVDPSRAGAPTRAYSGINPSGTTQTITGRKFGYRYSGDFACNTFAMANGFDQAVCDSGHTTTEQNTRLLVNSIVSDGADYSFPQTVIDQFECLSPPNVTGGNGSWLLGELQSANPGRVFVQGLPQSDGLLSDAWYTLTRWRAPIKNCTGEEVWHKSDGTDSPIRQLTIDRMTQQCVVRH